MKQLAFTLLALILPIQFTKAQNQPILESPSINMQMDGLEFPIHKVFELNGTLWATDYGSGAVFKSINNGSSWRKLTTLGSEYFEVIQFLDEKTGYICGDYGFIYKTNDGGESWTEVSPKIEGRITEAYRNDSTKNQQPDGIFAAYYSMYFVSEKQGYASGYKLNPSKGFRDSFERLLFTTKNGGKDWAPIDQDEHENTLNSLKFKARKQNTTFNDEYFPTNNESWKTAKNAEQEDIIIHTNYTTKTSDTVALPTTDYERIMLRSIVFLNENHGFVFGGSLGEKEDVIVFQTLDGGHSWTHLDTNWSHIHTAVSNRQFLWIFGKDGLMKRIEID